MLVVCWSIYVEMCINLKYFKSGLLVVVTTCTDSFVYAQDRIRVDGGRLTISNINLMDSGMYQCLAENDNGVIYASAELKVVGKHLSVLLHFLFLVMFCPKIFNQLFLKSY